MISEVMDTLKNKRCFGYDRIPLCFYIDGKEPLLPTITIMMRKIIQEGAIPEQWKIARVLPLHKKGNKKEVQNYRPISNLCSITKIFEKLILKRIQQIEQKEGCDLTGASQHGFKKHRSTETACLEIQSRLAQNCDNGEYMAVSSLDLSAAFDVVNHDILMKRLKIIGRPKQLTKVIGNWLKDRLFYCEIKSKTSFFRQITGGTIQGSILGPVLFAIYISPLEDITEEMITYANDNYNLGRGRSEEIALNSCIQKTETTADWMQRSGLVINDSKTAI